MHLMSLATCYLLGLFSQIFEMLQLSQLYLNISLFPKCASSPWLLNIWFSNQTWTTTSAVSDGSTKSAQHLLQVFKVYLTQIWKSFTMTMMMFRTWTNFAVLHHHHHLNHHHHHLHNDHLHDHHHLHNGDYIFTAITYAPIHSLCSLCGLQMQIRLIKSLL